MRETNYSRPFNFKLALGLPLLAALVLLASDPTTIDFYLAGLFYSPESGFIGRNNYYLETLLHDRAKQIVIAFGIVLLATFLLSLLPTRLRKWRRSLCYLVVAIAVCTGVVSPLKAVTAVHCPWSLTEFGGQEIYSPLLQPRAPTQKPGRCWPGGHATTGFSLLALFFALRDRHPNTGRLALLVALCLGSLFSLGRMIQGAHFLSHNLWTLMFDWLICLIGYRLILYRTAPARLIAFDCPTDDEKNNTALLPAGKISNDQ